MRQYAPRHVAKHTGVSVPQIKRWTDAGLITADFGGGGAKGKHRRYSFRNLFEVAIALELSKFQIPVRTMAALLEFIRFNAATEIAFWGYVRDPDHRPESFNAILQFSPSLPPRLISGSRWSVERYVLDSHGGHAFLFIPLHDVLVRLEKATGDRFPVDELELLDAERARVRNQDAGHVGRAVADPSQLMTEAS
jgi:hypothetical protein